MTYDRGRVRGNNGSTFASSLSLDQSSRFIQRLPRFGSRELLFELGWFNITSSSKESASHIPVEKKMQLCDQFRALVDKSIAQTPALDANAVEARYEKEFADMQPAQGWTELYDLIRTSLQSTNPDSLSFQQLRDLRKSIRYQSILGLAIDPYVGIAHQIQDACRNEFCRPFSEEGAWLKAIHAARSCDVLHGDLPDFDLRTTAVTEAARRLITSGYPVRVENDRLHLDPNQFNRLCTDIDADIRIIGGGIVLFQMFGYLKDTNQYEFERYIPGRVFGTRPRLPSLPVGYLLNLGVKHLDKAPPVQPRSCGSDLETNCRASA